jgi:hypothetical protein
VLGRVRPSAKSEDTMTHPIPDDELLGIFADTPCCASNREYLLKIGRAIEARALRLTAADKRLLLEVADFAQEGALASARADEGAALLRRLAA